MWIQDVLHSCYWCVTLCTEQYPSEKLSRASVFSVFILHKPDWLIDCSHDWSVCLGQLMLVTQSPHIKSRCCVANNVYPTSTARLYGCPSLNHVVRLSGMTQGSQINRDTPSRHNIPRTQRLLPRSQGKARPSLWARPSSSLCRV